MSLNLSRVISPDKRYAHWVRIVERIYMEQRNQAWSHYMFRLVRAVFTKNQVLLDEGGFIYNWATENYVERALMLLRRELDKQSSTENLRNLLSDIAEHPEVLTRARYLEVWGAEGAELPRANRDFDTFEPVRVADHPEQDHIDPEVIRRDLQRVEADAESVRVYAERTRAHRSPKQTADTSDVTFATLHKAISETRDVIAKYYALLKLSIITEWEPVPQFNTIKPFTRPWVVNPRAVREATEEKLTELDESPT